MYTELVWWTHGLLLAAVAAWIGKRLLFAQLGTERIVPKAEEMTPFAVVKQAENRALCQMLWRNIIEKFQAVFVRRLCRALLLSI